MSFEIVTNSEANINQSKHLVQIVSANQNLRIIEESKTPAVLTKTSSDPALVNGNVSALNLENASTGESKFRSDSELKI